MHVIMFGPPGYMWLMAPIRDSIEEFKLRVMHMRLCSLGLKYDMKDKAPSGSCMQVATTCNIATKTLGCACSVGIKEHVLDLYGQSQKQAEWRNHVRITCATGLLEQVYRFHLRDGRGINVPQYMRTHGQGYSTGRDYPQGWSRVGRSRASCYG